MLNKHFHWEEVRLAQVVDEATHIAVASRIYTVRVRLLDRRRRRRVFLFDPKQTLSTRIYVTMLINNVVNEITEKNPWYNCIKKQDQETPLRIL